MRRVTIAVIGNAKTTRANVEALISDVVDSVDEATIVSVFDQAPSEGILWAEQWAVDKGIPVLKYPSNDYETLLKDNSAEDLKFFMLWDDEDPECQLAASRAQEARILAYDLTDGLILIPLNSEPISRPQEPKIPIAETVTVTPSEPAVTIKAAPDIEVAEEDYEEEIDNVDYDSEYDLEENLVVLVSEMGKIFARSFAKEFKKIIKD
jgi:hypothetical protein